MDREQYNNTYPGFESTTESSGPTPSLGQQGNRLRLDQDRPASPVRDENVSVTFDSGAKRSGEAPYYSAIPSSSLRRLALRATGAQKGEKRYDNQTGFTYEGGSLGYGYGNWKLGLPLRDTFNHVIAHLYQWLDGVENRRSESDDHLAGAAWGIIFPLMTFETSYREEAHAATADTNSPSPSSPIVQMNSDINRRVERIDLLSRGRAELIRDFDLLTKTRSAIHAEIENINRMIRELSQDIVR